MTSVRNNTIQQNCHLVVGLGPTGFSCVRHLVSQHIPVMVTDSRDNPPKLAECRATFPDVPIYLGKFSNEVFSKAQTLVVSPGVSLEEPCIKASIQNHIPVIGDVELFAIAAKAPIVAITGSNGKSTVVTLMGELIKNAGKTAIVCGNIGLPVLEALQQPVPDYYVVELSSFQLDATHSLKAAVAVVINVSPDHMDRYATFADYLASKQRVYLNCENAAVNFDEKNNWENLIFHKPPIGFTLKNPTENQFGVRDGYLALGNQNLIAISDLLLQHQHNNQNYLAALAMGFALRLPMHSMLKTLRHFEGLPHRCQRVKSRDNIVWYNDSKGTNVGASIAAIEGIGQQAKRKIILIAGGDSKAADLTPLQDPIKHYVSHVILLGKDAKLLEEALQDVAQVVQVSTMHEAVLQARKIVQPGDVVLLSPACSSLDQYENYVARGNDFIKEVIQDVAAI